MHIFAFTILSFCIWASLVPKVLSYELVNSTNSGNTSIYLYDWHTKFPTWRESYNACRAEGQELLRIENKDVQDAVETLLKRYTKPLLTRAWTAGRGSDNYTWITMDGQEFEQNGEMTDKEPGAHCLSVKLYNNQPKTVTYTSDNCDEVYSNLGLLCQYDPGTTDTSECASGHLSHGGRCYVKTPYNSAEYSMIDWYKSQTYCWQKHNGVIAYSGYQDSSFRSKIANLYAPDSPQMWFGGMRKPWNWMEGPNLESDRSLIKYFHWPFPYETEQGGFNCISLDHEDWIALRCSFPLRYFLCMNAVNITT